MGLEICGRDQPTVRRGGDDDVSRPAVSIVVPTRNAAATLSAMLDAVDRQQVTFPFETIGVDSGSTDGTLEVLQRRVDCVITVPAGTFDHGMTRNLGIERARGDLVVLLVQDAEPVSPSWLAALTAPLFADPHVAGTFGRQQPRPGASPIARYYLSKYLGASEVARISTAGNRGTLESMDPMERFERCTFDNVCSCIRRSVWVDHPFKSTPIAEDIEWANEVLSAGHTLAFVPTAVVVHSHDRPAAYELRRTYLLHRRLYELFRLRTIPTVSGLLRAIVSSLAVHARCERQEGARMPSRRAVALAFAWPLGQYFGALSAVRGWKVKRSSVV
jgi:rhamnosyltransferase